MNRFLTSLLSLLIFLGAGAISWDEIAYGGDYYIGVGTGATPDEAKSNATADLLERIAVTVASSFDQLDDIENHNADVDHRARVSRCIHTYSTGTLTGLELFQGQCSGREPNLTARMYISKADFNKAMADRGEKARSMADIAEDCLRQKKIDMALQYYYWAYSLLRSLQEPAEVRDADGRILCDVLHMKINNILSEISFRPISRHGEDVTLEITYMGEPVSSLDFKYNDGRDDCFGIAKDGRGYMELAPGHDPEFYHISIEYQYKSQARGDVEVESVLNVVTPRPFGRASIAIQSIADGGEAQATTLRAQGSTRPLSGSADASQTPEASTTPGASQTPEPSPAPVIPQDEASLTRNNRGPLTTPTPDQAAAVEGVVRALSTRTFSNAFRYFTPTGLQMFNRLTNYGNCRVLDGSHILYYAGVNDKVTARGLRMAFSFNGRKKKTFVEDISMTFNPEGKIESVAFGLGEETEKSIYERESTWPPEVREILVSFLENYKTAYALERLDYLKQIFADNAVIIVGTELNPHRGTPLDAGFISNNGHRIINYQRYTKEEYLDHLAQTFGKNEFINIKFSKNEIQTDQRDGMKNWYAINIRQEYDSSRYADDGFLFLLVNMTDPAEPVIYVRTWQPNQVDINELYTMGDFFD